MSFIQFGPLLCFNHIAFMDLEKQPHDNSDMDCKLPEWTNTDLRPFSLLEDSCILAS